jgi:hypothetical protein
VLFRGNSKIRKLVGTVCGHEVSVLLSERVLFRIAPFVAHQTTATSTFSNPASTMTYRGTSLRSAIRDSVCIIPWVQLRELNHSSVCRDSSVRIATDYGLDGPGIESRWGRDFLHLSRPAMGPPSFLYNGYRVFPGGRRLPGRDAGFSPPSGPEV